MVFKAEIRRFKATNGAKTKKKLPQKSTNWTYMMAISRRQWFTIRYGS